jgi:multidrug efflux pump subunit AcrA (membrane-fusion protein)
LPQSVLVERGGVPGVFVLGEEGRARFRMVRTGKNINGRVEILSGLSGNETLVTGDLRDVHDGSPVKIMSAADKRG